jgi:hypothetical protein
MNGAPKINPAWLALVVGILSLLLNLWREGSAPWIWLATFLAPLRCHLTLAMPLFVQAVLVLEVWAKSRRGHAKVNAPKLVAVLLLLPDAYCISDFCPNMALSLLKAIGYR